MISYHMKHIYLTVLYTKAVACHVEWIALCLGPPTVELTLPLNAAECPKLSFATWLGTRLLFRLVHVVVDLIRVEVWMVKDPLYQIFQLYCVDIVLTYVFLQNVFSP